LWGNLYRRIIGHGRAIQATQSTRGNSFPPASSPSRHLPGIAPSPFPCSESNTTTTPIIPNGYSTLTPSLNLRGANDALSFYQKAFSAVERFRMPDENGGVMHGEFQIGDSIVMFCDESPDWGAYSPQSIGGCPLSLNLYVPDCDALTAQAASAAAEILRPCTTYP